jgi:3D (Asp-Asp-Asp) domain-containing protein
VVCILNALNNLKQMIKYLYSFCFLLGFTGLPVQAKWAAPDNSTSILPSKMAGGSLLPAVTPVRTASSSQQKAKVSSVSLTPDVQRTVPGSYAATVADSSQPSAKAKASRTPEPTVAKSTPAPVKTKSDSVTLNIPAPAKTKPEPQDIAAASTAALDSDHTQPQSRLARLTAYWEDEGDYYTGRGMSATGVRLHDGLCAVDPNIIPYGSVVEIAGVGKYLAVDTGSAVIARLAARESGHTAAERNALVIDIFFESRRDGEAFTAAAARYAAITWWTPTATNTMARMARSLFAEEDWLKIQSKQL